MLLILLLPKRNCSITDSEEKTEPFNSFFSKQGTLISNFSKKPANIRYAH